MSRNVTALLMGDPRPGRSAADGFRFTDNSEPQADTWSGSPDWSAADVQQLWALKAEGKSQSEIARITGRTLGAVCSKILRTRPK